MTAKDKAMNLRYKRGALASVGYDQMISELWDMQEACTDVRWFSEQDDETLLNALGDDDEAEWEFRMAFSDIDSKVDQLIESLHEYVIQEEYDTCTVALIGNRYEVYGWDGYEEDYFHLTQYEADLATTEAGKRLMRLTKPEIIATVGQCVGILVAFLDLRQQYDYLKATIDILRGENTSLLKQIKAIEGAYAKAEKVKFDPYERVTAEYETMLKSLPDRIWIE